jgi:hypothetical protein
LLQPDDAFWAAKQIIAFSDDDIRAVVATGEYSDPSVSDYVAQTLIARRDSVGRTWLTRLLPLDQFSVSGSDELECIDLAVRYGLRAPREYSVSWALYDNGTDRATPVDGGDGFELPADVRRLPSGHYALATITYANAAPADQMLSTRVYVRREANAFVVVGVERRW